MARLHAASGVQPMPFGYSCHGSNVAHSKSIPVQRKPACCPVAIQQLFHHTTCGIKPGQGIAKSLGIGSDKPRLPDQEARLLSFSEASAWKLRLCKSFGRLVKNENISTRKSRRPAKHGNATGKDKSAARQRKMISANQNRTPRPHASTSMSGANAVSELNVMGVFLLPTCQQQPCADADVWRVRRIHEHARQGQAGEG